MRNIGVLVYILTYSSQLRGMEVISIKALNSSIYQTQTFVNRLQLIFRTTILSKICSIKMVIITPYFDGSQLHILQLTQIPSWFQYVVSTIGWNVLFSHRARYGMHNCNMQKCLQWNTWDLNISTNSAILNLALTSNVRCNHTAYHYGGWAESL